MQEPQLTFHIQGLAGVASLAWPWLPLVPLFLYSVVARNTNGSRIQPIVACII